MPNFIEIKELFVDKQTDVRTHARTHIRTDRHLRPVLLGGLCRRVNLKCGSKQQ